MSSSSVPVPAAVSPGAICVGCPSHPQGLLSLHIQTCKLLVDLSLKPLDYKEIYKHIIPNLYSIKDQALQEVAERAQLEVNINRFIVQFQSFVSNNYTTQADLKELVFGISSTFFLTRLNELLRLS